MNAIDLLVFNWQDRLHPQAGGAETHLHAIFGRLAARGHRVTLVSSGWPGAERRTEIDGITVHRVGTRLSYALAAIAHYRRALRRHRFDLVIEDLNKVPLATPLWVREPVVLLVHHLFGASAFDAAPLPLAMTVAVLERLLMPVYSAVPIVAVSESSARDVRRYAHHADRVGIVYNGVDASPVQPVPDVAPPASEPVFLSLGRLQRYKRADLPIRALAHLRRTGTKARLVVAGRGPDDYRLRTLAAELGVSASVEFPGHVTEAEKQRLFAAAVAHVNTSVKEGWGISILEAAANGTTTIASDSPGLRDAVRHDHTGILVPHGDVPALAAAMRRLVDEPAYTARLSAAARAHAGTFTWDRSADALEVVLRETLLHVTPLPRPTPAPRDPHSPPA